MIRSFLAGFLALIVAASVCYPVASAAPSNTVYVRDYARGDCTVDDTAAVQAAIDVWRKGQLSRTAGTLDFGSGCYQINGTLYFLPPDGAHALFGTVRGDGPELAVLQGKCGVTTAIIRDFKYGSFGGLKFSGRCGAGNRSQNTNANHVGLMIGSTTNGMGTNGALFHNLTCEHYSRCYVVGDYQTGGSAAELIFRNVGASQSHIGVHLITYNTLDNLFEQLNVAETDAGVVVDNAYGNQFYNGAGGNNYRTFLIRAPGETEIRGWREEKGPNTRYWVEFGSPAADHHLTVSGSTVVDAVNPHRMNTEAIRMLTPASSLHMTGSTIHGSVDAKKLTLFNNTFTDNTAYVKRSGQWRIVGNNCMADHHTGTCTADIPPEFTGR